MPTPEKNKAIVQVTSDNRMYEDTIRLPGEIVEEKRTIALVSSDNHMYEVDAEFLASMAAHNSIEIPDGEHRILIPGVTGKILDKVIEYCEMHFGANSTSASVEDLDKWDADFLKVDQDTLFDLILAANKLNIKSLLDLTCQTVANMMKGKTVEELRETFHIKKDLSDEDEEKTRAENPWAFE